MESSLGNYAEVKQGKVKAQKAYQNNYNLFPFWGKQLVLNPNYL